MASVRSQARLPVFWSVSMLTGHFPIASRATAREPRIDARELSSHLGRCPGTSPARHLAASQTDRSLQVTGLSDAHSVISLFQFVPVRAGPLNTI